ncbi:MAG: hypothetical protein ACKVT1_03905 [Dehalococcoidia bacterium]
MNHRHVRPSAEDQSNAPGSPESEAASGHGGWRMAGMMLLCCIPMVAIIVLAAIATR